jgi:carboxypeptidase PM20D1
MLKKILLLTLLIILAIGAFVVYRTMRFQSRQINPNRVIPVRVERQSILNFQNAIRIKTISNEDHFRMDTAAFGSNLRFMSSAYPNLNMVLTREVINQYSLLYTWEGRNPALKPIILMGHMDVVPVEKESERKWKAGPFDGEIKQDTIWGRGTVDDKVTVIAIMEAVEKLVIDGFQPEQTIFLAFGHDEEISGRQGASRIAEVLRSRGVKADFVMDEGGLIMDNILPGRPVALIGTAEKGYLTVDLEVNAHGGHSSMPAPETAIDILSKAIIKIRDNPFEGKFTAPTIGLTEYLGPEMPLHLKMIFANRWLTKSLIQREYENTPGGYAQFHTTIAPTILSAGFKDNVLPTVARGTINFRILPGETASSVMETIRRIVSDDRVKVKSRRNTSGEPSPVSSTEGRGFQLISKTIRQLNPAIVVSPFLLTGATDSKHYADISANIYRYVPSKLVGFHGINERIAVSDYKNSIAFYHQLIKNLNTEN